MRGAGNAAMYDGYGANFVSPPTHSDGNEATSNGVEVSYISSKYKCLMMLV